MISSASETLDRKLNEILNFNSDPSSLKLPLPSTGVTRKPIFDHVLVEPLPQLDTKPQFVEEKLKPQSNHLPLKKRLIHRIENEGSSDVQEGQHASNAESHIETTKDNSMTPMALKRGTSINLVTPSPTSDDNARSSTSNQVANSLIVLL